MIQKSSLGENPNSVSKALMPDTQHSRSADGRCTAGPSGAALLRARWDNKPAIEVAPSCDGSLRKKSSGEDAMPHGFVIIPILIVIGGLLALVYFLDKRDAQ
jgi:hypothetical protein